MAIIHECDQVLARYQASAHIDNGVRQSRAGVSTCADSQSRSRHVWFSHKLDIDEVPCLQGDPHLLCDYSMLELARH